MCDFEGDDPIPPKRPCTAGSEEVKACGEHVQEERRGVDVSVIMPMHNASPWLDECLQAVVDQDFSGTMELSVFDDASTDDSRDVVESWREKLEAKGISLVISGHSSAQPSGVGYAKNKAICQSHGQFLCFQDADDVMLPGRVRLQHEASLLCTNALIGCKVGRLPEGSTERYTRWINTTSQEQLITQVYTSHGPTVIMPTWFCSRDWFLKVGPFDEGGKVKVPGSGENRSTSCSAEQCREIISTDGATVWFPAWSHSSQWFSTGGVA